MLCGEESEVRRRAITAQLFTDFRPEVTEDNGVLGRKESLDRNAWCSHYLPFPEEDKVTLLPGVGEMSPGLEDSVIRLTEVIISVYIPPCSSAAR